MAHRQHERRSHPRYPFSTSVQFFHGPSQKDYPGRCRDVSRGGMAMYVPASTPVQPGQAIRVNVSQPAHPELAEVAHDPVNATIVRVDRHALIEQGNLLVGVRFA